MNNNIKEELKKQARLELARRDFFEYCKLTAPDFYKNDRHFLKNMCNELQDFYESDDRICVINMPPRNQELQENWLNGYLEITIKKK